MKYVTLLMVSGIIFLLLFGIMGCGDKEEIPSGEGKSPKPVSQMNEQEILQAYPDDLDSALEELEQIE